jgi:outer membrane protein
MNQGRSIDPFTNAYLNQQINYASCYGIGTNLVLFNGFSMQNTIKQNAYTLDASRLEVQQVKENLTLNVIRSYLQVLNNEDLVEASKIQVTVT